MSTLLSILLAFFVGVFVGQWIHASQEEYLKRKKKRMEEVGDDEGVDRV